MRYFLLALTFSALACDSEPIASTTSPVGCWQSQTGRLDLMPTGQWQQTFDVSPTADSGTWVYDAGRGELTLSIANASSANGPGLTTWQITDLTPTEMRTRVGTVATSWQAVSCPVPICASVVTLSTCGNHASDGRPCAICADASGPVTTCHAFRDAAQGTGVTGPAAIADYECVASCDACL